MYYKIEQMV